MIKSALEVWTNRFPKITKVLVLCYKPHFITFSCYPDPLQGHQVVICDTAKEFITKLQREWSDQIVLKICTKRFPKVGRYGQHKIQRCIVHMNKKQTIPKIWKYWIILTISWYWKAKCKIENPSACFLLATTDSRGVCPFSAERIPGPGQPSIKPLAPRMFCACKQSIGYWSSPSFLVEDVWQDQSLLIARVLIWSHNVFFHFRGTWLTMPDIILFQKFRTAFMVQVIIAGFSNWY